MNSEPKFFLELAREHVIHLPRNMTEAPVGDFKTLSGHATKTIILSAAAIECGINLTMVLPVTDIKPAKKRPYFDELVRIAFRSSIRKRLSFIEKQKEGFDLTKEERKAVHHLLDLRNMVVHSNPEFKEYPAEPPHTDGLSQENINSLDGVLSVYMTGGEGLEIVWEAADGFYAAEKLLSKLGLAAK